MVANSRFLILPSVRVPNLASHVLSQALARLAKDWQSRYGITPVLVEPLLIAATTEAPVIGPPTGFFLVRLRAVGGKIGGTSLRGRSRIFGFIRYNFIGKRSCRRMAAHPRRTDS